MPIFDYYHAKTIAIMGAEMMTGVLLLERFLSFANLSKIIVLLKTKNNSFDSKSQTLETSKLFNLLALGKKKTMEKVEVIRFIESEDSLITQKKLPQIDVIFNCYMPAELQSKIIYRHILFPRKLVKFLEVNHKDTQVIVLSSIYSQNPGYVPEDNHIETITLPFQNNVKYITEYLNQQKMDAKQFWQQTVKAFQSTYFNSSLKNVKLIRVPTIGATTKVCEGYTDRFSSLTWLMYQVGMGQIKELKGNNQNIMDIVPADYVTNFMIVVAPFSKKQVFNLSASTRNPMKLQYFIEILNDYWSNHRIKNTSPSKVKLYEKSLTYTANRLRNRLPYELISKFATTLDLKGLKIRSAKKLQNFQRQQQIANRFQQFLRQEWLCESNKSIDLLQHLDPEEKEILNFNLNDINWKHYIRLNVYSIQQHILGLEVEPYSAGNIYVINKGKQYFDDIYWALTHGKLLNFKPHQQTKRDILNSPSVKSVINKMIEERTGKLQKFPGSYGQVQKQVMNIADAICERMFAKINMKAVRTFIWFMHKVFKQIYQQVIVDKNAIKQLKSYQDKYQLPLIVIPTHRSYIDFLIFPYIFFGQGIKTPMIGAADDFLSMALIHILFRKSGAFFITRNQKENRDLYLAILNAYCTDILCMKNNFKFFIEGTRSRLGKMMQPKLGLLNVVCDTVTSGKINDALIVPVTINYEKVLQAASFPYQLLGQPKVKESLGRLLKAVDVLKQNYGQIHIQICKPISIKQYFGKNKQKSHKQIVSQLGHDIVYTLSDNLVITPPALVATVILMQRKGISEDEVKKYVNLISQDLHSRGIKITRTQHNSPVSITSALQLMDEIVVKSKKNIFQVGLSANTQGLNIFSLCYYRNTLTHIYFLEAIVLVSLSSFGYEASRQNGVSLENLKVRAAFLFQLIKKEYVLRDNLKDANVFSKILDSLVKRQLITIHGLQIVVNINSELVDIQCSLIWPLVQSYWMTLLYFFKLQKQSLPIQYSTLLGQIQWFGETMVNQHYIQFYQAISQDTIKNALSIYSKMGLIKIIKEEVKVQRTIQSVQFVKLIANQQALKQLEIPISKYLKSNFTKTVKGRLQNQGKSSLVWDFPFLAKL